ncbi:MAG: hypothetical protein A2Y10_15710 [Planctomycetes bacterium GWF2_41_51]|nr:MAG: hypothetical protein A2Y10_15710 [Planctomycetes bacterium GWF2_41_51]HBG27622.1 hydrolase TatD [Phycisphaerales bacterium]
MLLHDTHLHLDLYNKQIQEIVKEIDNNHIFTIAVTNLPILYEKLKKQINSENIKIALGFHPELITQYNKYVDVMWKYINESRFIGEVGLDFINTTSKDYEIQISFFKKLIELCDKIGNKVLTVHSRASEEEVISILPNSFNGKIVLHWYSGSLKNIDLAINKGCFFSINYPMLFSKNGRKIIEKIPIDRLLLESDGPLIRIEERTFRPIDLNKTISKLAMLKNIGEIKLSEILAQNLDCLLKL